jgi:hypothetical protein
VEGLRRLVFVAGLLLLLVGAALVIFASLTMMLAILGPLLGSGYLAFQLRTARALWKSRGRLPIRDGVRVVGAGRTRGLAAAHVVAGLSGAAVGAAPAGFVFGSLSTGLALLAAGVVGGAWAAMLSDRLLATATGVDVLPPER